MYTATGFACLKTTQLWLEYHLPPSTGKEILNEFAKYKKEIDVENCEFGDVIKINYRIIIIFCFFKSTV